MLLKVRQTPPEYLLHPDDILIDMSTSEVKFIGPMTHEEKAEWKQLAELRDFGRLEIAKCEAELEATEAKARRSLLRKSIRSMRARLERVVEVVGEWPTHHTGHRHRAKALRATPAWLDRLAA